MNVGNRYTDGDYLKVNPTWHVEDAMAKVQQIRRLLDGNGIEPESICDVGCGAGEILNLLQQSCGSRLVGYDISPQAHKIAKKRESEKLNFRLADFSQEDCRYDLLLMMDVLEHVPDILGYLHNIKDKAEYKIFRLPLEMSVFSVLLQRPILDARSQVGHLHYFTKDLLLQMLTEQGYEVIDYFYADRTPAYSWVSAKAKLAIIIRKMGAMLHQDLAARVLGGHSLMVLCR